MPLRDAGRFSLRARTSEERIGRLPARTTLARPEVAVNGTSDPCIDFESASLERGSRRHARHAPLLAPPSPWLTVFSRIPRLVYFPVEQQGGAPQVGEARVIAAVTNALVAMPSMAGEPGKIFDFNLTLPIIATEFLLLMVIWTRPSSVPWARRSTTATRSSVTSSPPWVTTPPPLRTSSYVHATPNATLSPTRARLRRVNERARAPRAFPARATARSASRTGHLSRVWHVNRRSGVVSARCRRIATACESSFSRFGFPATRLTGFLLSAVLPNHSPRRRP